MSTRQEKIQALVKDWEENLVGTVLSVIIQRRK